MGEGGERNDDLWVDLRADRYIKLQFQGVGAHPLSFERRAGRVRGIYKRMHFDGRYAGLQLISEVQFCMNALLSTNGISAYQPVFGSNPADNFGWGDEDEDLLFAQDTSPSGRFVAQWELCIMAQEPALGEVAYSKLRRIPAFNNSFGSVDVRVGDEAPFYKASSRKSSPRWLGPARVLLLGESGAALSFQGQTFKVVRHCVRRKVRASAEPETSFEDAFDVLCRAAPPRETPEQFTNPPTDSLD